MQPDPKLVEELKAKYPDDVHQLGMPSGVEAVVLVRTPPVDAWDRLQDRVMDPRATQGAKRAAARNILMDALLYPTRDELGALLDRKPGLAQTLSNQLITIAGVDNEISASKL